MITFASQVALNGAFNELARKHCGNQAKWKVSMEVLHKKSGSQATLVKFREMVKRAVAAIRCPITA